MTHDMDITGKGSRFNDNNPVPDKTPERRHPGVGRRRKRGFTLLEMTVVVALLGVLSAVALPKFLGIQDSAIRAAAEGTAAALSTAFAVNYAASFTGSPEAVTFESGSTVNAGDLSGIINADLTDYTLVCPVLLDAGQPTTCTLGYDGMGFVPPVEFIAIATE